MKVKDILKVFEKLEMEIREGRDTLAFFRWQGQVILWTKVPHKRGELRGKLPYFIRQQLRLNQKQMQALISCDIWRDGYIAILQQKGIIPPSGE